MTAIHITPAAVIHYVERINPKLTFDQARARISASSKAIEAAAAFSRHAVVLLGDGSKVDILDGRVVDAEHHSRFFPSQMRRVAPALFFEGN